MQHRIFTFGGGGLEKVVEKPEAFPESVSSKFNLGTWTTETKNLDSATKIQAPMTEKVLSSTLVWTNGAVAGKCRIRPVL